MKQLIRTLLIIIAFIPLTIVAQNYSAKTSLDSTQYLIGDHITIHLEVTAPKGEPVEIPQLNQEIFEANHLPYDWISNSPIDTSSKKSQDIYKQDITIIAFDSGHYYFPQLAILSTDSQLLAQTDLLQFDITTIPVDTTAEFKDIKPITETTMGWHEFWIYVKEYLPYIIIIILVIALIAYLIYQMVKKHKQRPKVASAKPAKPKVKPHITALRALEHLRKKKLWEQGNEVIYGKRKARKGESIFKLMSAKMFYKTLNALSDVEIPKDTGDFRLVDRKVVETINSLPEHNKFLRGLFSWVGYKQIPFEYERKERLAGKTKYPLKKMLALAWNGITSFSLKPLKFISFLGGLITILSTLVTLVFSILFICNVLKASLAFYILLSIWFVGGLILLMMGLLGEYVGKTYQEVKHRPRFIIEEVVE